MGPVSPRSFDSDEQSHLNLALRFTENVDCPVCGLVFEGVFIDRTGAMSVEDLTDPPVGEHRCPVCGHRWCSGLTGWTFFSEAG